MEFDLRSTADHHSRVFSPPLSSGHRRLCPRADVKTTTSTSETAGASTFKAWVHPPRDTHKHTHTHEPGSPSSILPQVFFPPHQNQKQRFLESNRCSQSFSVHLLPEDSTVYLGPWWKRLEKRCENRLEKNTVFYHFIRKTNWLVCLNSDRNHFDLLCTHIHDLICSVKISDTTLRCC